MREITKKSLLLLLSFASMNAECRTATSSAMHECFLVPSQVKSSQNRFDGSAAQSGQRKAKNISSARMTQLRRRTKSRAGNNVVSLGSMPTDVNERAPAECKAHPSAKASMSEDHEITASSNLPSSVSIEHSSDSKKNQKYPFRRYKHKKSRVQGRHDDCESDDGGDEVVFKGINSISGAKDTHHQKRPQTQSSIGGTTKAQLKSEIGVAIVKTEDGYKRHPKKKSTQKRTARTGNIPDVQWRAIPMEHLRHHPCFEPLPHPNNIIRLKTLEDVRYFRQDSWQWDALHAGRCTTSQASAALGLLETEVGAVLGIPRSLRKGGAGAYHRLRLTALRDLKDMERVLCTGGNDLNDTTEHETARLWISNEEKGNLHLSRVRRRQYPFAAAYIPRITKSECNERRKLMGDYYIQRGSPFVARMQWGNTQEATAILTAINYFWKKDPNVIIKEVGMCGAGLEINGTSFRPSCKEENSGLIVGASPDAIIHHPNGTLEALEVKNHCPFVPATWGRRQRMSESSNGNLFRIRELPLEPEVPAAYVPQLMMEMLTLGPSCRSAVMVRQSATNGAIILRLRRDDEWINEMLYWLHRFMGEFVNENVSPPPNFFWDNRGKYGGGERYRKFIQRTKEICESVELVDFVNHNEIQRVLSADNHHLPLFLD